MEDEGRGQRGGSTPAAGGARDNDEGQGERRVVDESSQFLLSQRSQASIISFGAFTVPQRGHLSATAGVLGRIIAFRPEGTSGAAGGDARLNGQRRGHSGRGSALKTCSWASLAPASEPFTHSGSKQGSSCVGLGGHGAWRRRDGVGDGMEGACPTGQGNKVPMLEVQRSKSSG